MLDRQRGKTSHGKEIIPYAPKDVTTSDATSNFVMFDYPDETCFASIVDVITSDTTSEHVMLDYPDETCLVSFVTDLDRDIGEAERLRLADDEKFAKIVKDWDDIIILNRGLNAEIDSLRIKAVEREALILKKDEEILKLQERLQINETTFAKLNSATARLDEVIGNINFAKCGLGFNSSKGSNNLDDESSETTVNWDKDMFTRESNNKFVRENNARHAPKK